MKKLVTLILTLVLCAGLLLGTAHADSMSDFVGYWEVQNVAIGSYTVGANYLGFEMTAVVHNDGIFILISDEVMEAGYINGFGSNFYLNEGADRINLSTDSQGRMHLSYTDDDGDEIDIRMRKGKLERVNSRMNAYVGEWEMTSADEAIYGDTTMTLYNDGFGTIVMEQGIMAVRLGMQGGKVCLVDNEGLIMPITNEADGSISFTVVFTNEGYDETYHFKRVN
ncbi:MAG: hypothetical protein IJA83_00575 [Clostridia bacterium]|nr:hypothetical protein [Clostridia bacterium]